MPPDRLEAALAALDAAREVLAAVIETPMPGTEVHSEVPLLLRFDEAAEYGGLSRTRVFELVRVGELPAVEVPQVGRRIRRRDLETFVEQLAEAK